MAYEFTIKKLIWDDEYYDWNETDQELSIIIDVNNEEEALSFMQKFTNKEEKMDGEIYGWVEYGDVRFEMIARKVNGVEATPQEMASKKVREFINGTI